MLDDQEVNAAEDPEGAEEEVVKRDAARGMGPRGVDMNMSVGEFIEGLPPDGLTATVFIDGQWWHVKKMEWPNEESDEHVRGRTSTAQRDGGADN